MKADPSAPNDLFINPMYKHYVAQYQGDIISQSIKNPYIYATIIDDKYAIVSIPVNNSIDTIQKDIPAIVFIKRGYIYTLETITVMTAANINLLHLDNPLSLFGNGVLVGLVDTGIDYLNPEFMFKNGETRIHRIWDQTLPTDTTNQNVPFGVEYTKEQITDAINASKSGGNPYDIVNSKDTIGHGTSMAGVLGATGINPNLRKSEVVTLSRTLSSIISLELSSFINPIDFLLLRDITILSRPTNAPAQINKMFFVFTLMNGCSGCLRPPCGGTLMSPSSWSLSIACCTPSPETSRVILGLPEFLFAILSNSSRNTIPCSAAFTS